MVCATRQPSYWYNASIRLPNESDEAFRKRAERAVVIAKVLTEACLANGQVQEMLLSGALTERALRSSPIVRVDFKQAYAVGHLGETLAATRSKHWGDGPYILPLEPEDRFFADRISYFYKPESIYNRRFEQRTRMKELLGRQRTLVGQAKYHTKEIFLKFLTGEQATAIRMCLNVEPGIFWRAAKGKEFLDLPKREVQTEFQFEQDGA